MRNWPKLTRMQRRMMLDFRDARYLTLYIAFSRLGLTAQCLQHHGLIERHSGDWWTLTTRGQDYLRFGMRRVKKCDD
jgi:hypothetical protein